MSGVHRARTVQVHGDMAVPGLRRLRALAEALVGHGATGRTAASDPDDKMEVRVVAPMVAKGLAPPGRR